MSNLSFSQYQEAMKPFFDLIKGYRGAKRMIGEGIEGATAYVQNLEPNNPLQKARSPIVVEMQSPNIEGLLRKKRDLN